MVIMDSVDKIITRYFACVTAEPFTYQDKVYEPQPLRVSPHVFRSTTCPANCGACCKAYSLDYLPEPMEAHPYPLEKRLIHFNGKRIPIWSDLNQDHGGYYCRNVNTENGRCMIHTKHAFSCDFELTRFLQFAVDRSRDSENGKFFPPPVTPNRLTTKLYGRGHAMLRVDGKRGSLCEVLEPTEERAADVTRKLKRLRQWCEYFQLPHKMDRIIEYTEDYPRSDYIIV